MLRRDDEQRAVKEARRLKCADDLSDRGIHKLDLIRQLRAGQGRRVLVTTHGHARLAETLPNINRLEVHAEEGWYLRCRSRVCLARNLVQERVHFQRVIALDVCEAARPG